ncbi:LacI family transcriptional regulator [Wenjunlia vitaminophila]|uniref:LacI family transcriptional regulator n=1 Tax=Wenjunlia vitaminophila TaxID=76728 RepID=A0A0T6LTL4_WENVI|nr:LacI family DNA-binding transcriptional regulator [Wenjunlia vitaminophila]KRV49148.1 LacI family transcriptional regulator [Wenjunlia vitaminophila]
MPPRRSVTLSDVASVAGVSISTASRALSGNSRISAATRARIEEAARRLDFRPNTQAQSFAQGRSRTIGFLAQNARGVFAEPVLVGAATYLGSREQACLLYDTHFDPDVLDDSVRKLRARPVDGLLVLGDGLRGTVRSVTSRFTVPVAYAFGISESDRDASFVPDSEMAGRLAAEHLLSVGRTRIAHITCSPEDVAAAGRLRGLRAALADAGLTPCAELVKDWTQVWGAAAARQLVASDVDFDAVFCGNDHIALGVERALRELGRRVPDDVALIGVDDWETRLALHGPRHLTTINPNLADLGAAAARQVADDDVEPGLHLQPCTLLVGETTGGTGA